MIVRMTSSPAGTAGIVGAMALAALVCLAGCQQPRFNQPATSATVNTICYPGPQSAAPIFSPPIATAGEASEPGEVWPMEAFNSRPDWPVVSGVRMPEVVFYSEYYYDRQGDYGWWNGFGNGSDFRRTFRSFRSGLIVK